MQTSCPNFLQHQHTAVAFTALLDESHQKKPDGLMSLCECSSTKCLTLTEEER